VSAAMLIQRLVAERFGGALRIGIGINTVLVIGAGSKLDFALIGDTVNVAAQRRTTHQNHPRRDPSHPARPPKPWLVDRVSSSTGEPTP